MPDSPLRVAMLGLGTVGLGVAEILRDRSDLVRRRSGQMLELRRVVVRNPERPRDVAMPDGVVGTSVEAAVNDPEIDVLVEVMGGIEPAKSAILAALRSGKHVVTANKALLSLHGDEVFGLAREMGRTVCFEAAVAGGIPIIAGLSQGLAANRVRAIEAILNGTSNYILSSMAATGHPFEDVLADAQRLGYAEADPTMDIDGTDAAQKLAILVRLAFGRRVLPDQFLRRGIDTPRAADVAYARELGYAIKLLAVAKVSGGRLELHVEPTLVRRERPIAQVDGARNMVAIEGDSVGTVWWSGPGAGRSATASAVVADLIDLAVGRAQQTFPRLDLWPSQPELPLLPEDEITRRYYLRFNVEDRPHVLADIADVLGRHQISLASIIQHEAPEPDDTNVEIAATEYPIVPLVVMTHRAKEGQLRAAEKELHALKSLPGTWVRMPVAD